MAPRVSDQAAKVKEERREQLLAAALSLFAEKGYHDTTVTEIAARAGVSQGTIYWYFESKEQLFEAACLNRFDQLLRPYFETLADAERPAAERIMAVAEYSLDLFADNVELGFLLLQIMATQEAAKIVTYDFAAYYAEFRDVLAPLFEELGDPDPVSTAAMFIGLLDGLMLQGMLGPGVYDRDRVLAQIRHKFIFKEASS